MPGPRRRTPTPSWPGSATPRRHRGGDGTVRRLRFLERMTAAILSGHRRVAPFGVAGGEPGALNRVLYEQVDGWHEPALTLTCAGPETPARVKMGFSR